MAFQKHGCGLKLRVRKALYQDASKFIVIVPHRPKDDDPFSIAMQAETGHPCTRGVQIALPDILYVVQNSDGLYRCAASPQSPRTAVREHPSR